MSINSDLLQNLIQYNIDHLPSFILHLNDKSYSMLNVSIVNSSIPVNEPTTRGGVYFS